MMDNRLKEQCSTCKFSLDDGSPVLMCRRYPSTVKVSKQGWCGEHHPASIPTESPFQRQKARKVKQDD